MSPGEGTARLFVAVRCAPCGHSDGAHVIANPNAPAHLYGGRPVPARDTSRRHLVKQINPAKRDDRCHGFCNIPESIHATTVSIPICVGFFFDGIRVVWSHHRYHGSRGGCSGRAPSNRGARECGRRRARTRPRAPSCGRSRAKMASDEERLGKRPRGRPAERTKRFAVRRESADPSNSRQRVARSTQHAAAEGTSPRDHAEPRPGALGTVVLGAACHQPEIQCTAPEIPRSIHRKMIQGPRSESCEPSGVVAFD